MLAPLSGTRVVTTRFGHYRVTWIPLQHCPLPGFRAAAIQAVHAERPARAIRLTLFERLPDPGEHRDDRRAA